MNGTPHRTERNVQLSENWGKKTSPRPPYQWLILSGGLHSQLFSDLVYVTLRARFLHPPSALRSVNARLSLSEFSTKSKYILLYESRYRNI